MRRLLVNDMLSALPAHRTFWNDLQEWFGCEFVGGPYETLAGIADKAAIPAMAENVHGDLEPEEPPPSLIIRNASYFGPMKSSEKVPTICLLQDIFAEGPVREMQEAVLRSSHAIVSNSAFTNSKYCPTIDTSGRQWRVIPLPVDFSLFEPQNAMGCQQALGLPDGCVCWVGATQGPAGDVKGFDIFLKIVRMNPDLHFVAVLKDAMPESYPPNLKCYCRLSHEELAKVIGACRVGLCTSRMESQHLAGIEMGACGLPLVVPPVGTYWQRNDLRGILLVGEPTPANYIAAIRSELAGHGMSANAVREYWAKEFSKDMVRRQWDKLVAEVEGDSNRP